MKFILTILLLSLSVNAGLPPTSSKKSGESVFSTTFKTDYGAMTATRSGTTLTPTQTGTGAMTLATSPTLITPTIGAALGDSLALGGSLTAGTIISASSTTAAVIFPRMTTTQKNALTPVAGMELYDSSLNIKQYYNGSQWVANTNIQLDNVYSATVATGVGTITETNKSGWISSCSAANPSVCTLSGFTTAPACTAVIRQAANNLPLIYSVSATSISIQSNNLSSSPVNSFVSIHCQKVGADYQSADAYIASNSNTDWINESSTFGGISGISNPSTNYCKYQRVGGQMEASCSFQVSSAPASLMSMTIPNSRSLDSAKIVNTSTTAGPCQVMGKWKQNGGGQSGSVLACTGTSSTLLYFGNYVASTGGLTPQLANIITTGAIISLDFSIPISGWTNSNLIVASLAGTPNVPGYQGPVDTFSVSFGTTNLNTICSASPCFIDQIGNAVSSINWVSTGQYTLNTSKTYVKLKCNVAFNNVSTEPVFYTNSGTNAYRCENCTSLNFGSQSRTGATHNVLGTLICQGSY